MDRAFEQFLNFAGEHLHEFLGDRENLPHADTHELVVLQGLANAKLEKALVLLKFGCRTVSL